MKDLIRTVSALAATLSDRERQLLRAALAPARDPIAIVGLGCRFPGGADGPAAFWDLLARGGDAVTEVPADRWDLAAHFDPDPDAPDRMSTRHGAFLTAIDDFDAAHFELSPHEARRMDPQQRLLLEVTCDALDDAGIPRADLQGAAVGVFVGACNHDHDVLQPTPADAHTLTGGAMSVLSGRLSHFLGARGPSLTLDTACSSSLVALHLACASLRAGECDRAIVAGVNLMLSPTSHIRLSRMRALAADGRCRTFDARASGYVRGEGVAVVILERLADATRDHDRVWAVVRGSAVNHDGRSASLTAPNGQSQREVITRALADADAPADAVDYIEAHGTGTPLGDPIEFDSLRDLFSGTGTRNRPCVVGSVKTNIGHLEAAAGLAGVLKTVLALHHEHIPRHLHFTQLNPRIDPGTLEIAAAPRPWPRGPRERLAGVSSFGISGTNAHVILAEPPPPPPAESTTGPHLHPLSAPSPAALAALAREFAAFLRTTTQPLAAIVRTAQARRTHHAHRLAVIGDSHASLARALTEPVPGDSPNQPVPGDSLTDLAARYLRGDTIDWRALHGRHPPVTLPPYPWQRQRHHLAAAPTAPRAPITGHALFGEALTIAGQPDLRVWSATLDPATTPWLADHRLHDTPVLPAAAILDAALWAAAPHALADVHFKSLLELASPRDVQLTHRATTLELFARDAAGAWTSHATLTTAPPTEIPAALDLAAHRAALTPVDLAAHRARISATGLHHGPRLHTIHAAWSAPHTALAELRLPPGLDATHHVIHPALLDGCLQLIAAAEPAAGLPIALAHIQVTARAIDRAWCHVTTRLADDTTILADITLTDADGRVFARLTDLRVHRLAAASVPHSTPPRDRDALAAIVTAAVRETLGFAPDLNIPADQDLRDLGLDSLLALDLATLIGRHLDRTLANSFALDFPSVAAMTDALAQEPE